MALCKICPKLPSDTRHFLKVQGDVEGEERIKFGIGEYQNTSAATKFETSHQSFTNLGGFRHDKAVNPSYFKCFNSDELANAQKHSRISQVIERFFLLPQSTVKASSMLIPCDDTKCRVSGANAVFLRSSWKMDEQCRYIGDGACTLSQSSRLTSNMRERVLSSHPCEERLTSSGCDTRSSPKKCVPREASEFPKSLSRTDDQNVVAFRHTVRSSVITRGGVHCPPRKEAKDVPKELLPLKPEAAALAATFSRSGRTEENVATMATAATTTTTTMKVVRGSQPLLVFVLLLLFSPTFALSASRLDPSRGSATGQYDRGGPQHRITWGRGNPQASAVFGDTPTNVTAIVGHRARLPCTVRNLGLKDVTWIRQRDLHILTVGISTYTTDDRFTVYHPPETEDWFLDVSSVTFRDGGIYECQVTTSPKVSLPVHLTVLAEQQATIQGPKEVYIRTGSTISLVCEVSASWEAVGPVRWFLGRKRLDYSSPRGGISMEVEKTPTHTTSKLFITRAVKSDSGEYNCAPKYAKPSSVTIHIVNGEESRAVHSGGQAVVFMSTSSCAQLVFVCVIFLCARQTRRWH